MPIMPDELLSFARELLIKGGFQANHAKDTAQILVWADMRGTYSHGVLRIPRYIEMVETGLINPDAVLEEVNAKGAVVTLDANKMPGATAMIC
jgi:ureidoglycolate dehydrogenase (NAD+)